MLKTSPTNFKKKDLIKLFVIVLEVFISVGLAVILARWDELTLGNGLAILSANIAGLFIISHFVDEISFNDQKAQIQRNYASLTKKLEEIDGIIKIEETYKTIYNLENGKQKNVYLRQVENFLDNMKSRIEGNRSGALTRHDYYEELRNAGEAIHDDAKKCGNIGAYTGEIWAMTFWQDDELDTTDEYERAWVEQMHDIDLLGVKTNRICVLKHKRELLTRTVIDENVTKFLTRLKYYCERNPQCKNTTTYAIDSVETLQAKEQNWIGRGFFATKLSNGELRLIRGVSLDNINATTLGGEIDFDTARVSDIRLIWVALKSRALPISQYLNNVSSNEVKTKMKELEFCGID